MAITILPKNQYTNMKHLVLHRDECFPSVLTWSWFPKIALIINCSFSSCFLSKEKPNVVQEYKMWTRVIWFPKTMVNHLS